MGKPTKKEAEEAGLIHLEDELLGFSVQSMVAARNLEPYVVMTLAGQDTQLPVAKARMIGQWLMEVAEAAEQDAMMLRFFTESMELEKNMASQVLREYRQFRKERTNE